MQWPRGKVLGGSSSINGLIYIRGQSQDFDTWRQMGNTGWSYDDVLPYFRRAEHRERGTDDFHDVGGPLAVSDMRAGHELHDAFIAACQEAGYKFNPDFNGAQQEGVGTFQVDRARTPPCQHRFITYLRPAMRRPNLKVEIRALAQRVWFEGKRAVGLEYKQDGVIRRAGARCEVLLAGGSLQSPQLLQLSGVGPGALLQQHGIAVVHEHFPGSARICRSSYRLRRQVILQGQETQYDQRDFPAAGCRPGAGRVGIRARRTRAVDDGRSADRVVCPHPPDLGVRPIGQYQFHGRQSRRTRQADAPFPALLTAVCIPCRPEEAASWLQHRSRRTRRCVARRCSQNYLATQNDR